MPKPIVPSPKHPSGVRDRTRRVLVVEDTADSLQLFAQELERAGFQVFRATNGALAIDKARECAPDVVVLDLMLPDVNGITVASVLRHQNGFRGHILAVTALTSVGVRHAAAAAGCDAFMAKPTTAEAVVEEVRRLAFLMEDAAPSDGAASSENGEGRDVSGNGG